MAGSPRRRTSVPTGMKSVFSLSRFWRRAGGIASAMIMLSAAAPNAIANSCPVGGTAAPPPSHPTASGPSPCPMAAAIM
jgi:hypothetical protein